MTTQTKQTKTVAGVRVHDVIVRPLINEKSTAQKEAHNQYVFEVAMAASKADVKAAVERFFSVKVVDVHTLINRGKSRRSGQSVGRRSNWKKAIVTLGKDQAIDFFAQV